MAIGARRASSSARSWCATRGRRHRGRRLRRCSFVQPRVQSQSHRMPSSVRTDRRGRADKASAAVDVFRPVAQLLNTAPQPMAGVKSARLGVACRGTSTPISSRFTTLNTMPARKAGA